jgi:hypothetical protein
MDAVLQQQHAATTAAATLRNQLAATQSELKQHAEQSAAAHAAALARSEAVLATIEHIYSTLSTAGSAWVWLTSLSFLAPALILSWVITAVPLLHSARTALYVCIDSC